MNSDETINEDGRAVNAFDTEQQIRLDRRDLRGGDDLRFRVWASDGINTSIQAMPAGFALPAGVLTVKIDGPA